MPEYDPNLGAYVYSDREREKLAEQQGLADIRNWDSIENIHREAQRNKEEKAARDNAYLDPFLERAFDHAILDEELPDSLVQNMSEAKEAAICRQDEERARERQVRADRDAERNDRMEWERSRRG